METHKTNSLMFIRISAFAFFITYPLLANSAEGFLAQSENKSDYGLIDVRQVSNEKSERWLLYSTSGTGKIYVDINSLSIDDDYNNSLRTIREIKNVVSYKSKFVDPSLDRKFGIEYVIMNKTIDCASGKEGGGKSFVYYRSGDTESFTPDPSPEYASRPGTRGYDFIKFACSHSRDSNVSDIPVHPVEWLEMRTQPNGMIWSIDKMSVDQFNESPVSVSRKITFWSRKDFTRVSTIRHRYEYSYQEIDLGENTIKTYSTITTSPGSDIGEYTRVYRSSDIAPSSTESLIFEAICQTMAQM